jgi:uncharacterized protein (DUF362 family)
LDKSKVAIVRSPKNPNESEIEASVRRAIELVSGLDNIKKGDTVLIKPNICSVAKLGSAVYTNPYVSKAVAKMVREKGGLAVIGESGGVADDTEAAIVADGYGQLREEGYEVIDLKRKGIATVKVPLPKGKVVKEVTVPRVVLEAKLIISVPVMKTHAGQRVTLAMKNMKGILPDAIKKKFHITYGVAQGVIDLLTAIKPGLAVVDGILTQEGMGPMQGTPVEMDIIIAGRDIVAVDAVASAVMGFDPEEIPMIDGAGKAGLGISALKNIEVVGTPIQEVKRRFKRFEEAVQETLHYPDDFHLMIEEKACTGCRECLLYAMYDLNAKNRLDMLAGWTVVTGQTKAMPETDKARLLIVGNCLTKFKKLGNFVSGCPPWGWQIVNVLKGEPQDHPR